GSLLGTPAYMSPEQLRGEAAAAASDQFAFCVSLYEALYGERPFTASTLLELRDAVAGERVRPAPAGARVPRGVRAALLRGLRAAPGERFATIGDLLAAIERAGLARWRGRAALASLAVVSLASIALVSRASRPPVCAGADAEISRAWNDDARGRVRSAFGASGNPRAQETLRLVEPVLDAYATSWAAMRTQACEATRVRGVQSDEALDLRTACLDQRRTELETTVSLLASADAKLVDHAVTTVQALTALDRCADVASLRAPFAEPRDPDARRSAEDVRGRIARATALSHAQHFEDAAGEASEAAMIASRLGNRALEGGALLQKAIALGSLGKLKDARDVARDAALSASIARDDVTEAQAWTELVYLVGLGPDFAADADLYVDVASAAITRAGGSDTLRVELLKRRGDALWAHDRIDEACAVYREGVAIASKAHGEDSPITAKIETDVASCEADADHLSSSIAMFKHVLTVQEAAYGAGSPLLGESLYDLAFAELRLGDAVGAVRDARHILATGASGTVRIHGRFTAARGMIASGDVAAGLDEARAAIADYEHAYGASDWHAGAARDQLAETLVRRHLDDAALETCRQALDMLTAAKADPDSATDAHELRAIVLARRGRGAEALRELAAVPGSSPGLKELLARGEVALASRDFAQAVEKLEAASKLADSSEGLPEFHADVHLALARAIVGAHGDLGRARDLAARAAREYEATGLTALAREASAPR
ncbi:MAG TPA: hypothetical protein VMI75_35725, partial [Polyangiaceae bacterium]|nr:hypothetical protein [Polyangiaceae bacterium]